MATIQRRTGNQALQRLRATGVLESQSNGTGRGTRAEREAERVAERFVQAESATGTASSDSVRLRSEPTGRGTDGATQIDASIGAGRPLPPSIRDRMEASFGRDLRDVRVHTGPTATEAARRNNAEAYAVGTDLVFSQGAYQPGTADGNRLLAHETAHVVQQQRAGVETVQRQETSGTDGHPGEKPSPEEYIAQHTSWFNLDETKLGQDLFVLVWQSSSHGSFVKSVLNELASDDRRQVAVTFARAASGWDSLAELGMSGGGRTALRAVASALPKRTNLRDNVETAVEKGPQRLRERKRTAAQQRLKRKSGSESVTFYPQDPLALSEDRGAEQELKRVSKEEDKAGNTLAFGITEFENIGASLATAAEERGDNAFVRELVLRGHGGIFKGEGFFKAGDKWVGTSDLRENYATGQFAPYMLDGATIHFQACSIAKGEGGKAFIREVGRIFFGEEKQGYIKGNTKDAGAMIGIGPASPQTFMWPQDF